MDHLLIDWTYPVWEPKQSAPGVTVAVMTEHALPLEEAYALIAGADPRPLLVLRECEHCKGTDHALLGRDLDNEQTILLTHWFRCVRLPPNVLERQHPFFNLFERQQDGARVPHVFLCSHDGSNKVTLPVDQTQTRVWETLFSVLEREYVGDAKRAVKELRVLLGKFDKVDAMEAELNVSLAQEVDKNGLESEKAKRLQGEILNLQKDRKTLLAKEKQIRSLAQRQPAAEHAVVASSDAGK